jgi:hypothetical protein
MKAASVAEIKGALKNKSIAELTELCLRLARHKKDNKELLTYLLFEADDTISYINSIKQEIDDNFEDMNTGSLFWVKKSLRKILRFINKYIKYTGDKQIETEVRLHFCGKIREAKIPLNKNTVISNLYKNQIQKIESAMSTLHEDLQHDYAASWEKVQHYQGR